MFHTIPIRNTINQIDAPTDKPTYYLQYIFNEMLKKSTNVDTSILGQVIDSDGQQDAAEFLDALLYDMMCILEGKDENNVMMAFKNTFTWKATTTIKCSNHQFDKPRQTFDTGSLIRVPIAKIDNLVTALNDYQKSYNFTGWE